MNSIMVDTSPITPLTAEQLRSWITGARQILLPQMGELGLLDDVSLGALKNFSLLDSLYARRWPWGWGWLGRIERRVHARLLAGQEQINREALALIRRLALQRRRGVPSDKPSILVVVPYDITNPSSGAASRLIGLSRALTAEYRVNLLCIIGSSREPERITLANDLNLYGAPLTPAFEEAVRVSRFGRMGPVGRVLALASLDHCAPLLQYWIRKLGGASAVVIVDGPPLCGVVRRVLPGKTIFYEAHDVYATYVEAITKGTPEQGAAVEEAARLERLAIEDSDGVICASEEDGKLLCQTYGVAEQSMVLIPNGIRATEALFVPPGESRGIKAIVGCERPLALFLGTAHKPNVEAVRSIITEIAPRLPSVGFVIVGMTYQECVNVLGAMERSENVAFVGRLSAADKEAVMALCDVALCPITSGSGSSLKIPDYLAHGKPVVTTEFGMRGFEVLKGYVETTSIDGFASAVETLLDRRGREPGGRAFAQGL